MGIDKKTQINKKHSEKCHLRILKRLFWRRSGARTKKSKKVAIFTTSITRFIDEIVDLDLYL